MIALALLYFILFKSFKEDVICFLFVIVGYEFAYTTLRKEKNIIDNYMADKRYRVTVDEFLIQTYPGYKPPSG